MHKKLGSISCLNFGLYHKAHPDGDLPYLQVSQFDATDQLRLSPWESFLPSTPQTEAAALKPGQLILAAKGFRHFAWTYQAQFGPMVPSSVFFVIEPDPNLVLPAYLATYLNMPRSKALFQTLGAGTNIPSIRKGELANLRIPLPPLDVQQKIAELTYLHQQELALIKDLVARKADLYQSALNQLIHA